MGYTPIALDVYGVFHLEPERGSGEYKETGSHTLVVLEKNEVVHKIDEKYLPDVGGGNDFSFEMGAQHTLDEQNIAKLNEFYRVYSESGKTTPCQASLFYDNNEYKLAGVYYGNSNFVDFTFQCVSTNPGSSSDHEITSCDIYVIVLEGFNDGSWDIYYNNYRLN